METNPLAWHYTTGRNWEQIADSGVIRPATAGVGKGERPVAWFTLRDTFEPTARKMLIAPDGSHRTLSVEETARLCGGLVRIGVLASVLFTWEAWRNQSGVDPRTAEALRKTALRDGSDPAEWLVSFSPVESTSWASVDLLFRSRWEPIPVRPAVAR